LPPEAPLRVLAFVPYPEGRAPGQRFRIEQWAPLLAADGVRVEIAPFLDAGAMDVLYLGGRVATKMLAALDGYGRRVSELRRLGSYDAAYVYREAALGRPTWLEGRIARALPLVYDFDDAIYLPATSAANARLGFLKDPGKAAKLTALAARVTVGNEHLAAWARARSAPDRVTVVPSTIDTGLYVPMDRAPNPRPVIGWTGSATTVAHLRPLLPALARLKREVDFELRVIGGTVRADGLEVRNVAWSAGTEVDDLRGLDIGLMPLPDDEWSRGKCGMKALQYMALGIPPVVSPVGANTAIVRHGENGMHASSDGEWIASLAALARDPALRARLGAAARRTVEDAYSARVQAPRMAQVLRAAAAVPRRPR
jgi:glycosyltransferase involved in cell wall biosynthesis